MKIVVTNEQALLSLEKSINNAPLKKEKRQSQKEIIDNCLKTPQEFIHIKHDITVNQYFLWLLALKKFHHSITNAPANAVSTPSMTWHYVDISELVSYLGYRPSTNDLKKNLEELRQTPITYNVMRKDGSQIQFGSGFINQWSLDSRGKIGFILPDFIQDSILKLEMRSAIFQDLNLLIFRSFGSQSESFIYKLTIDYVGIGQTPYMPLGFFKDYLGLKNHNEFRRLNEKIIAPSVVGINSSKISDIHIEPVFKKNPLTRKIEGLHFKVKKRELLSVQPHIFGEAVQYLTLSEQADFLKVFSEEQISRSISRALQYADESKDKKPIKNLAGLFRRAIKDNWGNDLIEESVQEDSSPSAQPDSIPAINSTNLLSGTEIDSYRRAYTRQIQTAMIAALSRAEVDSYVNLYIINKNIDPAKLNIDTSTGKPESKHELFAFDVWLRSEPLFKIIVDEEAFLSWFKAEKSKKTQRT